MSDFAIIGELGKGSYGTVYRVKSHRDEGEYVLKKINMKHMKQKHQVAALKEVQILKTLRHPHVIQYFTSFMEDEQLHIVMEFAEKSDLYKLLKDQRQKRKYFSEKDLWDFSYQICLAVEYLHQKSIIHRDIKCLNIFLSKDKLIKIGDLGVSKIVHSAGALNGTRVGTPLYLSPELVKQQPYDFKIDIWAIGCAIYHLACLEPPFQGDNLITLGNNIVNKKPKAIPQIYSSKFVNFLDKFLAKKPSDRPSSKEAVVLIPQFVKSSYAKMMKIEEVKEEVKQEIKPEVKKEIKKEDKQQTKKESQQEQQKEKTKPSKENDPIVPKINFYQLEKQAEEKLVKKPTVISDTEASPVKKTPVGGGRSRLSNKKGSIESIKNESEDKGISQKKVEGRKLQEPVKASHDVQSFQQSVEKKSLQAFVQPKLLPISNNDSTASTILKPQVPTTISNKLEHALNKIEEETINFKQDSLSKNEHQLLSKLEAQEPVLKVSQLPHFPSRPMTANSRVPTLIPTQSSGMSSHNQIEKPGIGLLRSLVKNDQNGKYRPFSAVVGSNGFVSNADRIKKAVVFMDDVAGKDISGVDIIPDDDEEEINFQGFDQAQDLRGRYAPPKYRNVSANVQSSQQILRQSRPQTASRENMFQMRQSTDTGLKSDAGASAAVFSYRIGNIGQLARQNHVERNNLNRNSQQDFESIFKGYYKTNMKKNNGFYAPGTQTKDNRQPYPRVHSPKSTPQVVGYVRQSVGRRKLTVKDLMEKGAKSQRGDVK